MSTWPKREDSRCSLPIAKCLQLLSKLDFCIEIMHQMRNMGMKLTLILRRRRIRYIKLLVRIMCTTTTRLLWKNTFNYTTFKDFLIKCLPLPTTDDSFKPSKASSISLCLNFLHKVWLFRFHSSQLERDFMKKFGPLLTQYLKRIQYILTMKTNGGTGLIGKNYSIIQKICGHQACSNLSFWNTLIEVALIAQSATGLRNAVDVSSNQASLCQFTISWLNVISQLNGILKWLKQNSKHQITS